jgi:cytoskeletal protein RodZ
VDKETYTPEDMESSETLGQFLRRERSLRGVTLREISDKTKIGIRFLEALEEDDFDELPPRAFIVGFLRAYASCLKIDPEEVILVYERVSSQTRAALDESKLDEDLEEDSSLQRILLFVFAGILAVSLFYVVFIKDWSPRVGKTQTAPATSTLESKKGS